MLAADLLVVPLAQIGLEDIADVGGKNVSLGELIRRLSPVAVRVPAGFATTAAAYRLLIASGDLAGPLHALLDGLDSNDLSALQRAGAAARSLLLHTPLPHALATAILAAYRRLGSVAVAVRSSATAEDLPDASFAGQQETILNVQGEAALLIACRRCYASLFTDRAISYRQLHGYHHGDVALSIGVQRMVRADLGASGVMFTLDTETGFRDAVLLTAAYGLGENVVQGAVNPDEYLIFKPTMAQGYAPILSRRLGSKALRLVYAEAAADAEAADAVAAAAGGDPDQAGSGTTRNEAVPEALRHRFALSDAEALQLARWACAIEAHYSARRGMPTPMDIEWARDGQDGELYILQARPETVQSRQPGTLLRSWQLQPHDRPALVSGRAIGASVSSGRARLLSDPSQIGHFAAGDLLITRRTDPDWEPILRRCAGVVTDQGGRTCHAAIIARELGLTAIVGTGEATTRIADGQMITLSCCEGDVGHVYDGALPFVVQEQRLDDLPATRTRILINVSHPEEAFNLARIPCDGVGLARLEFIIANQIQVHPMALLQPQRLTDAAERQAIATLTAAYSNPADYYVDLLSQGMARIAAAFFPKPVILRFSDFKSNEYAHLLGGRVFEPEEENPMIGWRGASRYLAPGFRQAFALECQALKRVREVMGLSNVIPMVPFCRTPEEGDRVLAAMADAGLVRGESGLQVYVMCELPSNVIAAEAFAARFDGFSIGSNDLTQLVLGLDRDSALVAELFDERQPAVLDMIRLAIRSAHRCGRLIGICGQAPSDYPEFARFLVEEGIDSISLNPDAVLRTRLTIAAMEQQLSNSNSAAAA